MLYRTLFSGFLLYGGYIHSLCPPFVCEHSHPFLLTPKMDYTSTYRCIECYGNCSMHSVEHVARNNGTARSTLVAMSCISGELKECTGQKRGLNTTVVDFFFKILDILELM